MTAAANASITIHSGYLPGAIGSITEMHAKYYAHTAGFGQYFESKVAAGLAEFAARLDRPCNGLWLALHEGEIAGSIAIDGEDLGNGQAHLRWFITSNRIRGSGMGRKLLSAALHFCDTQEFAETRLWTFSGLDAARTLYEQENFRLVRQYTDSQWGKKMTEQEFIRPRLHSDT